MKANIFNIQKFSLHDGPGIRTVIFFKGCNLKCKWCCNPESQSTKTQLSFNSDKCTRCRSCIKVCKTNSLKMIDNRIVYDPDRCTHCNHCISVCIYDAIAFYGREYTITEVINEVLKDRAFYNKSGGGVTLSGGEFFLQAHFVTELCKQLMAEKIDIAVESSLAVSPDTFNKFIGIVDRWLVDIKHYSSKKHRFGTGVDNSNILKNIKLLHSIKANVKIRIPIIQGFNSSINDAENFASLLKQIRISKVELLPFHQYGEKKYELLGKNYELKGILGLNKSDLTKFSGVLKRHSIEVQIGG
ncbi:MAG: glycyl-radical enzyme activating protein [Spirochaetaceae bacterium]